MTAPVPKEEPDERSTMGESTGSRVEDFLKTARALLDEAERSARDERLVMRVGAELAASLDYEATLQNVARLVVADFADWCMVDVVDRHGRLRDVAVAHRDQDKEDLARTLVRRLPQLPRAPHGVARVLRTLQPESHVADEETTPLGHYLGAEYPDALRELGARCYICVPMIAGDKAMGAVTYVRGPVSPQYTERDLGLAQELARRAAVAIDNAMLHRETAEAVRERDELLAIFSHDVRNLIHTIQHNVDALRDAGDGKIDPECVTRINRAASRMKQLVDDTLDVSRASATGLALDLHLQEVEPLVSDAVDAVWSTARAKDVHIDARATTGLRLQCDPTRLFQALVNLLDNAIRYTPSGGRVVVEAHPEQGNALFTVSDPGPGIPEADLAHVFDRFWQGRNQRRAGAGLGLAIVKGVVDAHGGRVWVEGAHGQGTSFRFVVPLGGPDVVGTSAPGVPVSPPPAPKDAAKAPARATVFLADDDDAFRGALREALVDRGYDVREASEGATALGLLAGAADGSQLAPDVVVLDVRMPGCSGLGVLNAMGKLPIMPPTLLVTGFRDSSINVLAERLGVFRVLFKPVGVDQVVGAVLEAAQKGPSPRAARAPRTRDGRLGFPRALARDD